MRRLTYLCQQFPVVTETFTLNEVERLRAAGLEPAVVGLKPPPSDLPAELRELGARAAVLAPAPAALPRLLRAPRLVARLASRQAPRRALAALRGASLARRLEAERDHVHAQFPLEASAAALYATQIAGCTFSFSGHTLHRLDLMPEKLAAASFVVVGSEFERRVLCSRYGAGWSERIHVRRLGVPPRESAGSRDPLQVVSVGTLTGKKGHDVLLRALAELRCGGTPARLELVGEGPDRVELEGLARELGIEEHVVFLGALGHDETLRRIDAASAFALCCRETVDGDHDCLPVALMDAMSLGVPCVTSDAFGIPELIEHGTSGLLARPGDPVSAAAQLDVLLTDPGRAGAIGAAGRVVVRERYDLQANTAQLAELFVEQLQSGSRPGSARRNA